MIEAPNSITYSSVVSRDSIHIGFLLAYLHVIHITTIDLENSYLNALCEEKIWFVGGDECGQDKGRAIIIVRALYGLRSAGLSWRSALAAAFREIVLEPLTTDPNIYIRAEMSRDEYKYCEMLLVYVDYIMIVYHLCDKVANKIGDFYKDQVRYSR